jgi:hypothetical protein
LVWDTELYNLAGTEPGSSSDGHTTSQDPELHPLQQMGREVLRRSKLERGCTQ